MQLPGLTVSGMEVDTGVAQFDLHLFVPSVSDDQGRPAGLECMFTYASALFDEVTVRGFVRGLVRVLEAVVAVPSRPVGDVEVLEEQERLRVLREWSGWGVAGVGGVGVSLVSLFEEQVVAAPGAVAVVGSSGLVLSYGELDGWVNRLARWLIGRGVGAGCVVGLAVRRSVELVVAMLAVVKAGAGYVPLDPDQPAQRVGYVVGVADPVLVLVSAGVESSGGRVAGRWWSWMGWIWRGGILRRWVMGSGGGRCGRGMWRM